MHIGKVKFTNYWKTICTLSSSKHALLLSTNTPPPTTHPHADGKVKFCSPKKISPGFSSSWGRVRNEYIFGGTVSLNDQFAENLLPMPLIFSG